LQVIFRKRATNYRALLRKMTYEDKASYDSTPPCKIYHTHTDTEPYHITHLLTQRDVTPTDTKTYIYTHRQCEISFYIITYYNISYHTPIDTERCDTHRLQDVLTHPQTLRHIILHHFISFYIILYHFISFYIILYHKITYHIISYHVTHLKIPKHLAQPQTPRQITHQQTPGHLNTYTNTETCHITHPQTPRHLTPTHTQTYQHKHRQ